MKKFSADIIIIDDNLEGLAFRSVLEYWGVKVNLHLIGKSQDLVDLLGGKEKLTPCIFLLCHGIEKGIVLPELAEQIAKTQPYDKFITSKNLNEFLKLKNVEVFLNTGCSTGTKEFANSFLKKGAKNYIAPIDYPEGDSSLFYLLTFAYYLMVKKSSIKYAHLKARLTDKETKMFKIFSKK